jgi:hypothetical protein
VSAARSWAVNMSVWMLISCRRSFIAWNRQVDKSERVWLKDRQIPNKLTKSDTICAYLVFLAIRASVSPSFFFCICSDLRAFFECILHITAVYRAI